MPRNRFADMVHAQQRAQAFTQEWLGSNVVLPEGVEADEAQFAALMQTTLRALMQAYVAGFMEGQK